MTQIRLLPLIKKELDALAARQRQPYALLVGAKTKLELIPELEFVMGRVLTDTENRNGLHWSENPLKVSIKMMNQPELLALTYVIPL